MDPREQYSCPTSWVCWAGSASPSLLTSPSSSLAGSSVAAAAPSAVQTVLCWWLNTGNMQPNIDMKPLTTLISSVKWRGAFLSLFALMVGIGIFFSYVLGSFLYWRLVSSLPTVLGYILLGTGLISVPESPIWLLSHRGVDQARQSLLWLRYEDDGEILWFLF